MNIAAKQNQVSVCKGNVCLTVAGEIAKALAVVVIIAVAVNTIGQLTKVLK